MLDRTLHARVLGVVVSLLLPITGSAAEVTLDETTAAQVRAALRLDGFELLHVNTVAATYESATLSLALAGQHYTLDLARVSLRAADFRLRADVGGGVLVDIPAPPPETFRGAIRGMEPSRVAARLNPSDMTLTIQLPDQPLWHVQPLKRLASLKNLAATLGNDAYIAYSDANLLPGAEQCGTASLPLPPLDADQHNHGASDGGCLRVAEIAFDADVEYYQLNNSSVPETIADIESVLNAVEFIYARDALVRYSITQTLVRTVEEDPYTATNPNELLGQFRTTWNEQHTDINRDIAHFFTGKEIDGNVIGIAYLRAVCNLDIGYGLSQSRYTEDFARRTALTAHELGHNWSAQHCNGDSDCAIMCSGIGGCSRQLDKFGERSVGSILAWRNAAECLTTDGGYATQVPPRARRDEIGVLAGGNVTIDVLANDHDGNCAPVTISAFDPATPEGGAITRSIGTGPGGRDQLVYAPPPGFTGGDSFSYTISDGADTSDAAVEINIVTLRPQDSGRGRIPGVRAEYYDLSLSRLPDFAQLTPYLSESVANIDFPSSDGPFAGSSRSDEVGAVFTGTLTLAEGGAYTFSTESDDGSALFINGTRVVDNDGLHGMEERSGTITLPAGEHALRVEYFEGFGGAGLIARIEGPGLPRQVIPPALFTNLTADYYNLTIAFVPNFTTRTPYRVETVPQVNFPPAGGDFATSGRGELVGARFSGFVTVPQDGAYQFFTASDNGSNLFIGAARVVDNDGLHQFQERDGWIGLEAGTHAIRVEFFQRFGTHGLVVSLAGAGLEKQVIPAEAWLHRAANGDMNCDDAVNFLDIDAFVLALVGQPQYDAAFPTCDYLLADTDASGAVDFNDINLFVQLLVAG